MSSYVSEGEFSEQRLDKLKKFVDDNKKPTAVTRLVKEINYLDSKYGVFEIAKLFSEMYTEYKIENNQIIASEVEKPVWKHVTAFINKNSKMVYLNGYTGWPTDLISTVIFNKPGKISPREIDIKAIEKDIRNNGRFTFNGTSFEEPNGTKISISNPAGLDIRTDKHLIDTGGIEKKNLKILIQKDDKNFSVTIYPNGKITFGGRIIDEQSTLGIFMKVFTEIEDYATS